MSRPELKREVSIKLKVFRFSPRGVRGRPDVVDIFMDELQAVKYADLDMLGHKEAALKMNVSRQTMERILKSGRGKIARGIVEGKIINIMEKKA